MTAKTRHLLAAVVGSIVALSMVLTTKEAVAQTVLRACYVSNTGIVYRILVAGAPDECRSSRHFEFSWTDANGAVFGGDAAGGDLGGTYPNPIVDGLQGNAVSGAAPSNGQVLTWNGASWTPTPSGVAVSDHGALTGLDPDDDHTQYVLADGVRGTTNGFAVTGAFGTGSHHGDGPQRLDQR